MHNMCIVAFHSSSRDNDTVARTSTFDLNNNNNDGRTRIISNDIRKSVLHRISEISVNEDSECINKNQLSCQQSPSRQAWKETETDQSDNVIDNLNQSECTNDNLNQSECTIDEMDDLIGGDIDETNQSEYSIHSTHDLIGANSDDEFDTDVEEDFPEVEEEPLDSYGRTVYREECLRQQIIPITSFIKQLPEEKMTLKFRGFNEKASNALSSALSANSRIEICDLSNNNMGYTAGLSLVEMLKENTFITHLDLSENQLGNAVGIKLGEMLLTNIYMKTLILKGNKFTNPVARIFAEVFKTNDTLVELDLSYNEFHENGSLYLGAGLALNESIEVLSLKWNSIRGKGGVAIAAALSKNSTLRKLDLSWNGLAFIGCLAIGRHLKKNSTLEHLDISNNRIGCDGATKLVGALSVHPVLETFKIGLNPIGDEGVQKILKAMEKNSSIYLLSFEKITICQKTLWMIENLQKSRDIEIITGGMGGFSKGKPPPGNMEVLVQFIQDNRMRLTDIFFRLDKDRNDKITKGEFVKGLMNAGLKMDKGQITNLIDQLDTNNDGDIEFSEILSGQQLVMNERRFQKKITKKTEQMEKDSIRLPKIHGF
ncbi:leucine-rich repeat-containing protein 74B-like [Clytia hemisphaerica]|uniref:EF-hand domain-containing protein n=1 Tax=Clytia hemisphaerica TaxID=252671 RepID=A0A7M5WYI0_9CNID